MMEQLKLAQSFRTKSREKKREILKKVDVKYSIPDVTYKNQKRYYYSGYTSLHFAVKSSIVDLDLINDLLEQGSDLVKQGAHDGCTPIHVAFNEYTSLRFDKATSLQKNKCINTLLSKQVEMKNILNPKSSTGISHFHIACVINHFAAVEFLAKSKENVNQRINCNTFNLAGYAPLHCAIKYSSVEAAEILLQHGADIDLKDAKGMSCVHLLIDRMLDVTDFITMGKCTHCMPYEEEIEKIESIIQLVLKARASDKVFMDDIGLSALHLACILRDKSIVENFLKQNVDVNLPVQGESEFWPGWTPVHFAACCNIETMILLMQRGADITVKNSKGETALDLCAKRFALSDIQQVLSVKNEYKDIVLSDSSTKLMDLLSAMDTYEKFSDFLQKLEDVNITIPSNSPIWPGCNLLHVSVSLNERAELDNPLEKPFHFPEEKDTVKRNNSTEDKEMLSSKRIDLLLEYGCSTSAQNADGQTPIHLAFGMLSLDASKKLLRCDKEDAVDPNGLTHLHIACALDQLDAVERYVRGGTDVNARAGVAFRCRELWGGEKQVRADSTPLHVAVIFDHEKIIKYLLANNADVHAADSLAFTPIHLALSLCDFDFIRLPLEAATATNLRDCVCAVGLSHLHVAAYAKQHEAVKQLLLGGADIERVVDKDVEQFDFLGEFAGKTPLHLAQHTDAFQAAEILLRAGANIHVEHVGGFSALHYALLNCKDASSRQLFQMLRESGKSDEIEKQSDGITLLHVACAMCDVEWAERLLAQGANVNARARAGRWDGLTPLHVLLDISFIPDDDPMYSPERRYSLVELLADRGADVTIKSAGSTPLCWLYLRVLNDFVLHPSGDGVENAFLLRSLDLLLKSQESYRVNPVGERGFSHFHFACLSNNVETATKFLDHGADVNQSIDPFDDHDSGFTPLHFAMAYKRTEVAYLLLDRGADVNAEDADGNTPLHVAFGKRFVNLPLMEAMIRRGADVRAKNSRDYTLLHFLVKRFSDLSIDEHLRIIERTGMGSCLYQRDIDGNTPFHLAMDYNNPEALDALFCIGFNINSVDLKKEFRVNTIREPIRQHRMKVAPVLACQIWKIRFVRLDLTNSNLRFLELLEKRFSLVTLLEQPCQDELTKAEKTEICEGITVKSFLAKLGAAAAYPKMHAVRRAIVDKYFKCVVDLHREFPEFCGLLVLQYRKALERQKLMQPAKQAIALILPVELPELCLEAVLRFFTNNEMKVVIDLEEELFV